MNIKEEHSDDAVNIAPDVHHIIYEDDMVRVLKVSMQPGGSTEMHWHPRNINYILSGGNFSRCRKYWRNNGRNNSSRDKIEFLHQ